MDDERLGDLLASAILRSACATARCRVSAEVHHFYVDIVHLDPNANAYDCPGGPASDPRHTISTQTLIETPREVLVAALAAWLSALHQHFASSIGGDGAPGHADPSGSAPFDSGADGAGADPICWDSVASVPGD